MSITIKSPALSPSLNEYENATITDENSNVLPVIAVVSINSSGHSGVASDLLTVVPASQVTGRVSPPLVQVPGGYNLPLYGLMSIDTSGNPIPFQAASAATATTATSVSGKFQSTIQTGTGSAQNIAHGLGVVPSLVLVSIYDTNGVSLPFAISEGTHTITNIVVTVTASVMFKVIAFV